MKKIRNLHIITRLDPGGSSTNTIETAARLDRNQFDVFLISGRTVDPDGTIEGLLKERGISYIFVEDLQREIHPLKDIKAFIQLYGFIRKGRFDIVHTHTSKAGILGRWAAKLAGVRIIVHTPHGHVFYGYFGKFKTGLFIWIERFTALITHKIITLTNLGKREHIDFKIGPADQFVTIHSGINLGVKTYSPDELKELRKEFRIPEGRFIFGSVARLVPIKGISYIIDAMAQIVKEHPQTHLILVGDGSDEEQLKKHCEDLGLNGHVTFTGFQYEVHPFIQMMDVFVLASLNEGMGRVILEAMVCAKPVIATRVGGVEELVDDGKNGFLVPPKDARALSLAMIKCIKHQQLEDMAKQAKLKVGNQFNLDKMVKDIEELYLNCVQSMKVI